MALAYTLAKMFTQEIVIERNTASVDALGAAKEAEWEPHVTVKGRLWWWKGSKSTDKSASQQYARPQATINETGGDLAVALGTDGTEEARVAQGKTAARALIGKCPFRVRSVNPDEDHLELSLERP